jgi:hypothetical protein
LQHQHLPGGGFGFCRSSEFGKRCRQQAVVTLKLGLDKMARRAAIAASSCCARMKFPLVLLQNPDNLLVGKIACASSSGPSHKGQTPVQPD